MINICLCDDENSVLSYYDEKIRECAEANNKLVNIQVYHSGESLLFDIEENPNRFNIIIIDIYMKRINGIDTIKKLREYGYKGLVIFLTSSRDFALEAFGVEAFNYIIKEVNQEDKFKQTVMKAIKKIEDNYSKQLVVKSKKNNIVIELNSIIYFESILKKVIIYQLNGTNEEIYYKLNDLENKLSEYGFIRCHKSYIVNAKYIMSFNNLYCKLKNKLIIPVGRKYSKAFKERFKQYEFDNLFI